MSTAAEPRTVQVQRVRPSPPGSVEEAIYSTSESLYRSDCAASRLRWTVDAAAWHLDRSAAFQRIARARSFRVEDLAESGDYSSVPLLSTGTFKKTIIPSSTDGGVKYCRSSGTTGTQSVVPRDNETLERYVGSIVHGLHEFVDFHQDRKAFVLGPPTEEAGDLWFAYSISLAEVLHDTEYFVHGDVFEVDRLIDALSALGRYECPVIVGPPGLLLDLLQSMEDRKMKLELGANDPYVLTAGGWKRAQGRAVSRAELNSVAEATLGVPGERVRDLLNMVELNSVIFECERQRKHVPPWLTVTVRSPRDLSLAGPGETGILAFIDPSAVSYPAFVLSDDLGKVYENPCPCGRSGRVVELTRRLNRVEERGCALKMDRYSARDQK